MKTTVGTCLKGIVELDSPVTWPEGMKVQIAPVDQLDRPIQSFGLDERTWVETPDHRAALIASVEAYDPPEISDEEWAEFEFGLKWIGDYTKG